VMCDRWWEGVGLDWAAWLFIAAAGDKSSQIATQLSERLR
jgi:hypothetical protein